MTSSTPTTDSSAQLTRPEHMFEPDSFPTRLLFVMLSGLALAVIVAVLMLTAYFESAAQAELAAKDDRQNPELVALRKAEAAQLQGYGFAACPEGVSAADGGGDLLCKPQAARYYVPYNTALPAFLEQSDQALAPTAPPPGVEPLPLAPPGAGQKQLRIDGAAPRDGGAVPAGARIEQRPRMPAGSRPKVPVRGLQPPTGAPAGE